jgi:hypothetical protein
MSATADRKGSEGSKQTLQYFGWLTLFVYLTTPAGYLIDVQTSYILKNELHATATQVSTFRLLTGMPIYLAFVSASRVTIGPAGIARPRLLPDLRAGHRPAFAWMAVSEFTYTGLVVGMLLAMRHPASFSPRTRG